MNTYSLTIKYNDGRVRYDMTMPTRDTIEKVQSKYDAMVKNAKNSIYPGELKTVSSVLVEA